MEYLYNKKDADEYFNKLLNEIKSIKITNVFTLSNLSYVSEKEKTIYYTDTELYIMLENNKCIVISYLDTSLLGIEYRYLSMEELNQYNQIKDKDFFNMVREIYDSNTMQICSSDSIKFEYSSIIQVVVHGFSHEFETWRDNKEVKLPSGGDYFNRIDFCLGNGNKICMCPKDVVFDGYLDFWVEVEEYKKDGELNGIF